MQTIKYKLVCFKSKELADRTHPIMLRVTVNGKRKHYSLLNYRSDHIRLNAIPSIWDSKAGRYSKKSDPRNDDLDLVERRVKDYLDFIKYNKQSFTFIGLEKEVFTNADSSSVYRLLEVHIEELNYTHSYGTVDTYKGTYQSIKSFTRNKDLPLSSITPEWLGNYSRYLKSKYSLSTTSIYLRCIRRIFNKAIEYKLVGKDLYPFGGSFRIGNPTGKKRALAKKEIIKIINLTVPQEMQNSQNYFTFSYLTRGMNFVDMANLRWDKNIINNRIEYLRAKTKDSTSLPEYISIPIGKKIDEILANYTKSSTYIFPIVIDTKIKPSTRNFRIKNARRTTNKHLKQMAKMAGIEQASDITMYWARHTYATVLKQSGESVEMISELLGHKDIKTTQIYLGKFDEMTKDATDGHLL